VTGKPQRLAVKEMGFGLFFDEEREREREREREFVCVIFWN
jgi:hypothetical protein